MADDTDDALKKHRDLLIACGWGKEVDVILLLQQGASVRVQDQDGKNCLHYAACKGHIQVTNLLIENGCAINAKDKCNRTPLHLAAEEGHNDIVSILLDNNAVIDVQDEDGYTPCHVACLNDHTEVLELLIHVKSDLILKSRNGLTPLHVAAVNGNVKSMSLLIKAGVCTSPQDMHGNTPLHLVVQEKSLKGLKCLIKNDINVNVQNYVGDTAKDIAIRHGFREMVQKIPDPFRRRKSKQRNRNSDSPAESQQCSNTSPIEQKEIIMSPLHKQQYQSKVLGNSSGFIQHPSEEIPTATSSSLLSLWVPTTDSGISLPMDTKVEHISTVSDLPRRRQKKAVEKFKIVEDQKLRHLRKESIRTHEYAELRNDPRFVSSKSSPKRTPKSSPRIAPEDYAHNYSKSFNGAASDESNQYTGCFFKTKQKNVSRRGSLRVCNRKNSIDHEKELMMQRQAELHYQLNTSKLSLEKQMRKMRKKFEKAVIATDNRFVEQKKREETFHNQLRTELEIIEKSLERGSKRNVEEFSLHIKKELTNLAEKLTKGLDLHAEGSVEEAAGNVCKKTNKRASAVDLDKDISVSLANINLKHSTSVRSKPKDINTFAAKRGANGVHSEDCMRQIYEQRLKDLESEVKRNARREKENEELRARVLELEQILKNKTERTSNGVT